MSIHTVVYWIVRAAMSVVPFSTRRVRVGIICENKILLVKNMLGSDDWTLPGGGIKKGERPGTAANREIKEELNIDLSNSKLQRVDTIKQKFGLYSESYVVYVTASASLKYKARKYEIRQSRWFELESVPVKRSEVVDAVMKVLEHKRQAR